MSVLFILKAAKVECELRCLLGTFFARNRKGAETHDIRNGWKNERFILKPNQPNDILLLNEIRKEIFGEIICRYTRRQDESCKTKRVQQSARGFGKNYKCIDVTRCREWETVALPKEFTGTIGSVDSGNKFCVKCGIFLNQLRDEL